MIWALLWVAFTVALIRVRTTEHATEHERRLASRRELELKLGRAVARPNGET